MLQCEVTLHLLGTCDCIHSSSHLLDCMVRGVVYEGADYQVRDCHPYTPEGEGSLGEAVNQGTSFASGLKQFTDAW